MSLCGSLSRRDILAGTAAAFTAGCGVPESHPGRLRYLLRRFINTIDPVTSPEDFILAALFEPLIQLHPETMEPMAGLAAHCLIENNGARYTFYLRGHSSPRGTPLPSAASLNPEFTRGRRAAPCDVPARWSDGAVITAEDCVFSWRRYFDPASANPDAYNFYCVAGARDVIRGTIPPEQLGVRQLDRFTFQVDLVKPAPYFLLLCHSAYVTPRHIIEQARRQGQESSWVQPGRIATSGPFQLAQFRPYDSTLVTRSPTYYDADFVGVEEIEFWAADGATVVNLFHAGLADSMEGRVLPLQLAPVLKGQPALNVSAACASHGWRLNTNCPPLHNPVLRYALNMATDKEEIARFLGVGQIAAKTRVPPLPGYGSPTSLPVTVNGRECDVLAFNPHAAAELWATSPTAPSRLTLHYPARVDSRLLAEIQQQQWRLHLGLQVDLQAHEPTAFVRMAFQKGDFEGVAEDPYAALIPDPYDFLGAFNTDCPTWSDPAFDAKLNAAAAIAGRAERMQQLAACESDLLRAMPVIPLYYDNWVYLERPDLHGLSLNPLGVPAFKYAWIDSNPNRRVQ